MAITEYMIETGYGAAYIDEITLLSTCYTKEM
jgi:hypothetical protein